MYKPFHPTVFNLWRRRGSLIVGRDSHLSPNAIFSITRGSYIKLGKKCRVSLGAILASYGGWIEIGDSVSINPYSILYGHGGLRIGNDVRIAAHCTIIPANHVYTSGKVPIGEQGVSRQGIKIADDVWIGANCVILDGTSIGDGCVVAAGGVVRGTLPPYGVYAGVPVRKIGERAMPPREVASDE